MRGTITIMTRRTVLSAIAATVLVAWPTLADAQAKPKTAATIHVYEGPN
jgi:uncharacterized protein YraI